MPLDLVSEHGGNAARVIYDNAHRGNCFDLALLTSLADTLESAASDKSCKVVRLEMVGKHFCTGWDVTSFDGLAAAGVDAVAASLAASDQVLDRIRNLPVPIVAAVRGQVIGFGAGLLAALHLPVAATDVRLSLPEVGYGFAPAGVGHTIAQALPRAHAYSVLTGTVASAQQLLGWGLVTRVVAEPSLDAEVDDLVAALAAVPGNALRGVVEVVESSRATGSPDQAYTISARTIVGGSGERDQP